MISASIGLPLARQSGGELDLPKIVTWISKAKVADLEDLTLQSEAESAGRLAVGCDRPVPMLLHNPEMVKTYHERTGLEALKIDTEGSFCASIAGHSNVIGNL